MKYFNLFVCIYGNRCVPLGRWNILIYGNRHIWILKYTSCQPMLNAGCVGAQRSHDYMECTCHKTSRNTMFLEVILAMSSWILSKLSVDWPPGSTLSEVILAMSSQILSKLSVNQPPGSTLSEVILAMSSQILSKLSVSQPPRSTLSEVILAMSLWTLFKLSVDQPLQDQHCQR